MPVLKSKSNTKHNEIASVLFDGKMNAEMLNCHTLSI